MDGVWTSTGDLAPPRYRVHRVTDTGTLKVAEGTSLRGTDCRRHCSCQRGGGPLPVPSLCL